MKPRLRWEEHRGIVLLFATVLLLLVMPWAEPYRIGRSLLASLFVLTIAVVASGRPGRGGRRAMWLIISIAPLWVVSRAADPAFQLGGGAVLHLTPMIGLILVLVVLVQVLDALATADWISTGVLATGFTGYLFVAIGFAELYGVLADVLPNAFNTAAPADAPTAFFTYFSLVTIASLGFGDVVPTHPFVRLVAALEGVCGLFYTAVVVARLVAVYSPHRARAAPPTPETSHKHHRHQP